jgi:hypothetical protein
MSKVGAQQGSIVLFEFIYVSVALEGAQQGLAIVLLSLFIGLLHERGLSSG